MTRHAISGSATVAAVADVLATELGGEVVMLNLSDGIYYGLEDVGARLWTLLKHPITVADLCGTLVLEFDVEPDRCERDVRALLNDLLSRGLVEIRDRP
jgi:hypothetical protein